MRPLARALILVSALTMSSPLLAQEITVSAVKAFTAKMDAAAKSCDVDTIINHISELATISGTGFAKGDMRMIRMNKAQYRQLMTALCAEMSDYHSTRADEKIVIDRDQAIVTAEVTGTFVLRGQRITSKARERATLESIDGKLMFVQIVSNEVN